jgi:mannose-6-phosphate isomerase-like protein (cupin superfamily)
VTPEVGTELVNPKAGTRMVFTATAESTGGAYVEVWTSYPPDSAKPPLHKHPSQREDFGVVDGSMEVVRGEETFTVKAGETFGVDRDTPHQMWAGVDGAVFTWRVSPALRTGEMFCELWAVARDHGWEPDGLALFGVISKYDAEFCLC